MEVQNIQNYFSKISRSLTEKPVAKDEPFWGHDGFDFKDVLDIVNPLQHIPVISKFYREQTEDKASEGSRLMGGLVLGGLIGGASGIITAIANSAFRHQTQQNISDYLITKATRPVTPVNMARQAQTSSDTHIRPDSPSSTRFSDAIREENPFFAQLLELEPGSQSYLDYTSEKEMAEQETRQRITEWGKV